MKLLPTLDLQNLNEQSLSDVDRACVDYGFFTLVGHGLNKLIDRELTKHRRDQKEVFDYHVKPLDDPSIGGQGDFNFWPDDCGGELDAAGLQEFHNTLCRQSPIVSW